MKAWVDIMKAEVGKLDALVAQADKPVLLALAPSTAPVPVTDVPLRPYMLPKAAPLVEAAPAAGRTLAAILGATGALALIVLVIVLMPSNIGQKNNEDEFMRKVNEDAEKRHRLAVIDTAEKTDAATNTTNNECAPQTEQNKKNGAECENDGYVIMETALKFKRLVDPPKGKGLDGLFEKLIPFDQPNPMPQTVTVPKPGKLLFLPNENKPPQSSYDFTGKPPVSTYPKFVVFEGKHISKSFDEKDTDGIEKETKNRLKNTCDGQQMSEPWTDKRIPQALNRQNPGQKNKQGKQVKQKEIDSTGYARWLFICLPGPMGMNTKLYVFIDVVGSGMDLESMTPIPRKAKAPDAGNHGL